MNLVIRKSRSALAAAVLLILSGLAIGLHAANCIDLCEAKYQACLQQIDPNSAAPLARMKAEQCAKAKSECLNRCH